jgi:hypothetical protein
MLEVSDVNGDSLTCEFDFDNNGTWDDIINNCKSSPILLAKFLIPNSYRSRVRVSDVYGAFTTSVTSSFNINGLSELVLNDTVPLDSENTTKAVKAIACVLFYTGSKAFPKLGGKLNDAYQISENGVLQWAIETFTWEGLKMMAKSYAFVRAGGTITAQGYFYAKKIKSGRAVFLVAGGGGVLALVGTEAAFLVADFALEVAKTSEAVYAVNQCTKDVDWNLLLNAN